MLPLAVILATGGAGLTFAYYLLNTYEGKIYSLIEKKEESAQAKNFPANYSLSESLALDVIGLIRSYAVKGFNIYDNDQMLRLRDLIINDLKLPSDSVFKNKLLAFLMIIRDTVKTTDKDLYEYLKGGLTDRDKTINRVQNLTADVSKITPSVLNPNKLLWIGGSIAALYFLWPLLKKLRNK